MPKNSTRGPGLIRISPSVIFGELLKLDAEGRELANNFLTEGQNNFGNKIHFFIITNA